MVCLESTSTNTTETVAGTMLANSRGAGLKQADRKNLLVSVTGASNVDRSKWSQREMDIFDSLMKKLEQKMMNRQKDYMAYVTNATMKYGYRNLPTADLDLDDQDFTISSTTFTHIFHGPKKCLMGDPQTACHHEVCERAYTRVGISCLEYFTILDTKYKIHAASTERRKNALRKQREGKLLEDQQEWLDWQLEVSKAMETVGYDACRVLSDLAPKDRQTSKLLPSASTPDHPIVMVGRMLSRLLSATLSPEQQESAQFVRQRIQTCKDSSPHIWWDPASYLVYFGPIDISHIDAVVMNICEVLNLNASLPYEIHYCLRSFLKQFKDILKHAPRSLKSMKGVTVAQILHYAIELIKEGIRCNKRLSLPRGEIYDSLLNCSTLDCNVQLELQDLVDDCVSTLTYPDDRFELIKNKTLQSSPLPSISEISLAVMVPQSKRYCVWATLIKRADVVPGAPLTQELVGQIRILAGGCPSKFRQVSEDLGTALTMGLFPGRSFLAAQVDILRRLLTDAEAVLLPEAIEYDQDAALKTSQAAAEAEEAYQSDPALGIFPSDQQIPGMTTENCKEYTLIYMKNFILDRHGVSSFTYNRSWVECIRQNMWRGIVEAFLAYRHLHPHSDLPLPRGGFSTSSVKSHLCDEVLLQGGQLSALGYLPNKFRQGWQAPETLLQLLDSLCRISALNPASRKKILEELDGTSLKSMKSLTKEWRESVMLLILATRQFYGFLVIECTSAFGRYDIDQVVMTILWLTMAHVLAAETKLQAVFAFEYMMEFLAILGLNLEYIDLIKKRFTVIFQDQELRCVNLEEHLEHIVSKVDNPEPPTNDAFEALGSEAQEPE